jgi:hypothetical protein
VLRARREAAAALNLFDLFDLFDMASYTGFLNSEDSHVERNAFREGQAQTQPETVE